MKKSIQDKRENEKEMIASMISMYCKHQHQKTLCSSCKELKEYAWVRAERCPFMENKTFCSQCKVHCYETQKRLQIKQVMRYAGPRMLLYHPVMAISHWLLERKGDRK